MEYERAWFGAAALLTGTSVPPAPGRSGRTDGRDPITDVRSKVPVAGPAEMECSRKPRARSKHAERRPPDKSGGSPRSGTVDPRDGGTSAGGAGNSHAMQTLLFEFPYFLFNSWNTKIANNTIFMSFTNH